MQNNNENLDQRIKELSTKRDKISDAIGSEEKIVKKIRPAMFLLIPAAALSFASYLVNGTVNLASPLGTAAVAFDAACAASYLTMLTLSVVGVCMDTLRSYREGRLGRDILALSKTTEEELQNLNTIEEGGKSPSSQVEEKNNYIAQDDKKAASQIQGCSSEAIGSAITKTTSASQLQQNHNKIPVQSP